MFIKNKVYIRQYIHNQYGGNSQSGISNCRNYPYIFIFSGGRGEDHGYIDRWDSEGYFYYTGEGTQGDMSFTKGNAALRDHLKNGKSVFLFEFVKKGEWKYIDELVLVDYKEIRIPDSYNNLRRGIEFIFRPNKVSDSTEKNTANGFNYNIPNKTEREGLIVSRVGQGWYRKQLIERWNGMCAVTGLALPEILIASHIVPWREATDQERMDIDNGILLSPDIDALFDRHLISFDDEGRIMFSNNLDVNSIELLGITFNMGVFNLTPGNKHYMKRHRNVFDKHQ